MIAGICMVRDEADIIEATIRHHLAEGLDRVYVADNLSTDGTRDILNALVAEGLPLFIIDDPDPAYEQATKMTKLARRAMANGADWIVPFDADEFFYSPDGRLADVLAKCPPQMGVIAARGWDHIARDDSEGLSVWRRPDLQPLPKVVFRASSGRVKLHMGNHGVDHPLPTGNGPVEYRHFQYRSLEQLRRKVTQGTAAYALTDFGPEIGAHWRQAALDPDAEWSSRMAEDGLVFDPAPIREKLRVEIIIPTLGKRPEMLDGCVRSLKQTAPDADLTVQTDIEGNGFAHTCNKAGLTVDEEAGDIYVFLNDDTVCHPGWLEAMLRRHRWGIVGAHLTYPSGDTQHSGIFFRRDPQLTAFNRLRPAPSGEVPAVTGACLMVSRETFDNLGGFDESFVNGYEDVDLCLRARQAGHRVWYASDAEVTHLESQSEGRFDHAQENIRLLQERWGDLPL